jgi:TonB family protein
MLKTTNVPLIAAVLTLLLHGTVFCVPGFFLYLNQKPGTRHQELNNKTYPVEIVMLPAIKEQGNKSAIRQADGKKTEQQEQGLNGQAAKQGGRGVEKEMLTYQDIIKQRIQEYRRYPPDAKRQGIEGGVNMAFTLLKGGQLKEAVILKTSGDDSLDREALATINRAAPYPVMPDGVLGQEIKMQVRIIFKIE